MYRLPKEHRLRMKSTNMLERYNEELRRRTRVVRIFPNAESCLRLILALAAETHERWLTEQRYLYGRVSAPTGNCRKFLTQLPLDLGQPGTDVKARCNRVHDAGGGARRPPRARMLSDSPSRPQKGGENTRMPALRSLFKLATRHSMPRTPRIP